MQKIKPLGKGSFLRSVLRALGIDKSSASLSPSKTETQPSIPVSYISHVSTRTALLEAELAKGKVLVETRKKIIF